MTTELILLLFIYATVLIGVFIGPDGLNDRFHDGAPQLAARIEHNLSTGKGFNHRWLPPQR